MKHLILLAVLYSSLTTLFAQSIKRDITFQTLTTNRLVKVSVGDKLELQLIQPDTSISGKLLSFTNTTIILSTKKVPYQQIIPLSNIQSLSIQGNYERPALIVYDTIRGKKIALPIGRKLTYRVTGSTRMQTARIEGCTDSTLVFSSGDRTWSMPLRHLAVVKVPNHVGTKLLGGLMIVGGIFGTAYFDFAGADEVKILTIGMMIGGLVLVVKKKVMKVENAIAVSKLRP